MTAVFLKKIYASQPQSIDLLKVYEIFNEWVAAKRPVAEFFDVTTVRETA